MLMSDETWKRLKVVLYQVYRIPITNGLSA